MTDTVPPQTWTLSCGTRLTLREALPFDTAPPSGGEADGRERQALVVVTDSGLVVAEALWLHCDDIDGVADFEVVVGEAWRRLGIGRRLLRAMAMAAWRSGVRGLQAATAPA